MTYKRGNFNVGDVVRVHNNGTLSALPNNGALGGQVVSVSGDTAAVKTLGKITARYTGGPNIDGFLSLVSDGNGNVKLGTSNTVYAILHLDADKKTVTFIKTT